MPNPASPRFDLASVSQLQSRDGRLTKGGLIKNGFVEGDKGGEAWCWQRPALSSGTAAPLVGSGLGLYLVGTALWAMYHSGGTGTGGGGISFQVRLATNTATSTTTYTLVAVANSTVGGIGYYGTSGLGSVAPGTWAGKVVGVLAASTTGAPQFQLAVAGTVAQTFYEVIRLNGSDFRTSEGTAFLNGGHTWWQWSASPIVATGTYTGFFTK